MASRRVGRTSKNAPGTRQVEKTQSGLGLAKELSKDGDHFVYLSDMDMSKGFEFIFAADWAVKEACIAIEYSSQLNIYRFARIEDVFKKMEERVTHCGFFAGPAGKALNADHIVGNIGRMLQMSDFGTCAKVDAKADFECLFTDAGKNFCGAPELLYKHMPVSGTIVATAGTNIYKLTIEMDVPTTNVSYPYHMIRWFDLLGFHINPSCLFGQCERKLSLAKQYGVMGGMVRACYDGRFCVLMTQEVMKHGKPSKFALVTPPSFDDLNYEAHGILNVLKLVLTSEDDELLAMAHREWTDDFWEKWNEKYAFLVKTAFTKCRVKAVRVHSEEVACMSGADLILCVKPVPEKLQSTLSSLKLNQVPIHVSGWMSVKFAYQVWEQTEVWKLVTAVVKNWDKGGEIQAFVDQANLTGAAARVKPEETGNSLNFMKYI